LHDIHMFVLTANFKRFIRAEHGHVFASQPRNYQTSYLTEFHVLNTLFIYYYYFLQANLLNART
jgi:hypothetical protein